MIQTKIENLVLEFLALSYISAGYATGTVSLNETALALTPPYAGQTLHLRPGETVEGQTLPAVHVVAEEGQEDEVDNQTVVVSVSVVFPCDPDLDVADQLARLDTETERVIGILFDDDLGSLAAGICTLTTDASIIGVYARGSRRSFDGHRAVHELTLTCYCAGSAVY